YQLFCAFAAMEPDDQTEQGSRERAKLLGTSFAQYERAFHEQMADMFAPGGFDPRRDIAGIILNRWGHACANPQPGFFFRPERKPGAEGYIEESAAWTDCVCEYG